jgi:hypothetical protein
MPQYARYLNTNLGYLHLGYGGSVRAGITHTDEAITIFRLRLRACPYEGRRHAVTHTVPHYTHIHAEIAATVTRIHHPRCKHSESVMY